MSEAEREAEKQSISQIELYKKEEKKVFREIEKLKADQTDKIDFRPFETALKQSIEKLRINLMDIEIKLQQALTESRS